MLDENYGQHRYPGVKPVMRLFEWLLGVIAVVISVAGVLLTLQQIKGIQYSGPMLTALFTSLWPLPSLVLIGWVLLSFLGLLGIVLDTPTSSSLNQNGNLLTSIVCGALFALAVLGMFSIGPMVLIAALALGGAACLAAIRKGRPIGQTLLAIVIGAAISFSLLLILIIVVRW